MLVRVCAAGNGPITLNHPCLASLTVQPASFLGHEGLDAHSSWLKLCIAGWIAFLLSACFLMILVRERWERERNVQAQKSAACRRAWRLATAAVITEQAWDKDRQQAAQKISEHQEREENMKTALGCGKTFVFDPAEASNFGAEVAGACAMTMHNRMDLMPEPWMDPARNYFLAACRAWGGLVWRWLNSALCEVISCGSCGCNGGAALLEAMQARVMGEGARFLILKSLMGGEDFWRRQGFEHFTCSSSVSWWADCSLEVRKAFIQFKKQSGLRTFVKKLPGADPQPPPGPDMV